MEAGSDEDTATLQWKGESFSVPTSLLEDKEVFKSVVSRDTWDHVLTEEDRKNLYSLLPDTTDHEETLRKVFSDQNFLFGSAIDQAWQQLNVGSCSPSIAPLLEQLRKYKMELYKQSQQRHHIKLVQELLLSRRKMVRAALASGSLDSIQTHDENEAHRLKRRRRYPLSRKASAKYKRLLRECCDDESDDTDSSSEEDEGKSNGISNQRYLALLKKHKQNRRLRKRDPGLDTTGITLASVAGLAPPAPSNPPPPPVLRKKPEVRSAPVEIKRKAPTARVSSKSRGSHRRQGNYQQQQGVWGCERRDDVFTGPGNIYEVYSDPDKLKNDGNLQPIILEAPLPTGQFMSFFSVIKRVFDSLSDLKGELNKITEMLKVYLQSSVGNSCSWLRDRDDWPRLTLSALMYLGAEVGAVSSFSPLPHYTPLVEFRDRIDHWKWIGAGRDSDIELLVLCNHWLSTLDKALPVVDYSDYTPPLPRVKTYHIIQPSKPHELDMFRSLELQRYESPHKAFTFSVHGFEAAVGPVKGARPTGKKEQGSRARGHALLKQDRPNCVTILSLVRDACSRLPNGEGTRLDLCVLVRDSCYIATNISDSQLNNAVSGALDRLHYEKDPCVRYINSKKLWIYLHRDRTEEEFEHISWAYDAANRYRKIITARPKSTPKILFKKPDSQLVDITPVGGSVSPATKPPSSGGGSTKQHSKGSKAAASRPPVLANVIAPTKAKTTKLKVPSVSPAPSSPAVSQKRSSTNIIPTTAGSDSDSAQLPFIPSASSYNRVSDDEDSSDSINSCDLSQKDRSMDGGAEYDFEVGPPSWLSSSSYTSSSSSSSSSSDSD